MLAQASVWRGSRAHCATSQSEAGRRSSRTLSRMLCTTVLPQSAFFSSTKMRLANRAKTISDT